MFAWLHTTSVNMLQQLQCCLFLLFITSGPGISAKPLYNHTEHPPLAAELSSRVAAHNPRLQQVGVEPRFPLPSPQELESIKKVAQILVMLGEQVIPAIIGDTSSGNMITPTQPSAEIPNDAVDSI